MKKLLYILHAYQLKTKSNLFLQEILAKKYEIETFAYDPYSTDGEPEHFDVDPAKYFNTLQGKSYDVLVLFQVMPRIADLKKIIHFKHGVFFPMFDGSGGLPDSFWQQYRNFKIINFSKTLHTRLEILGLTSYYIQYFPKPIEFTSEGGIDSIFFWQRVSNINIRKIENVLKNVLINHIHIHKVLDPAQKFIEPSQKMVSKVSYSSWYDEKKDILTDIEQSALYIAPREYEGIGMSFLEAMAMGRCVVAQNNPTMNEYISHNKTGILFDINNIQAVEPFDIRKIQRNTISYIKSGYEQWSKQKESIPIWIEASVKLNILYDISILKHADVNGMHRTGIFFTAFNILNELLKRNEINIFFYCIEDDLVKCTEIINFMFPAIAQPRILTEKSDYSFIDAFFSPVFPIPEKIKNCINISCYTVLYDLIMLFFPQYFKEGFDEQHWFQKLTKSINNRDYYFSISENTKKDFLRFSPNINEKKIITIPLAANENFYNNKNKEDLQKIQIKYSIPAEKKYILSLCSLEPRKNLITAIKAFILFMKKNKSFDLIYVLCGASWEGFDAALEMEIPCFESYRHNIIKTGYIDDEDLAVIYSNALWFVYTSEYEGFGLPPLEAMQCGCPVITSNNSSLPEVVGSAGIMIDFDSLDQHISAYEQYYFDENFRLSCIKKSLKQSSLFSWKKCTKIILQIMLAVEQRKKQQPLVTIVTITRNLIDAERKDFFIKCIESVKNQTYPNIEHIIIDGASTDGTLDLLNEYKAKGSFLFYSEPDTGVYDAMNKGIQKARGKYINFLNSDDFFHDTYGVERTIEYLERDGASYAFSDVQVLHKDGNTGIWAADLSQLAYATFFCHQSLFVQTEVAKKIGGFDLRYKVSADSDFVIKLYKAKYDFVHVPFCFVSYRMGGLSGLHSDKSRMEHSHSFFKHIGTNIGLTYLDCYLLWQLRFFYEVSTESQIRLIRKIPPEFNPEVLICRLLDRWKFSSVNMPEQSLMTKKVFLLRFKYSIKHFVKFCLFKCIHFTFRHPKLKNTLLKILEHFPKIKRRLRSFM